MENFTSTNGQFYWWFGVVEDRNDPLRMGRCRVRILGYHVDDTEILPTEDLPWAMPVMPANSASVSGVGWSPTGAVEGSWVVGFFADGPSMQHPMFWGTVGAVPGGLAGTGCSDGEPGSGEPGSPESSDSAGSDGGSYAPSPAGPAKEFWTLVAICSKEAGSPQDQCDVAQSIYNRAYSGAYTYRTLSQIILDPAYGGQYEPVKVNRNRWLAIDNAETAARATGLSTNTMKEVARRLKNTELQNAARSFVGARTDFLGYRQPMDVAYRRGSLVCRDPRGTSSDPAVRRSATRNKFGYNNNYTGRAGVAPIPDIVKNTSVE